MEKVEFIKEMKKHNMTINNKVEEAQKIHVYVFIINYPYYNNMLEHESKKNIL